MLNKVQYSLWIVMCKIAENRNTEIQVPQMSKKVLANLIINYKCIGVKSTIFLSD